LLGPSGTVVSSGTLDASAGDSTSSGGSVSVLGERVGLFDNAVVNVSGATNGGTALIGGDEHGANPNVLNAQLTYVSPGATINADAGAQGNGGRAIVWSDDTTRFDGQLSARGGSLAGDGGFAEVSGKQNLQFNGGANLTAAHGAWGTLLLDPDQIVIDTSNTDPGNGLGNDSDWKFNEDPGALPAGTVGASVINGLLATGSVTLEAKTKITQNASADITSTTSGSALTLDSKGDIELNAAISLTGADVNVIASNHIDLKGTSSITTTGTGQITLAAGVSPAFTRTAGTSTITLEDGSKITGGTGLISLHAIDAISIGATGSGTITGGGNVTVQSDNDAVTMVTGSSIASAGSGTISMEGAGPVQVAAISSTGGSVSVTSDADSISDDGDTNSRIVANSATLTSTATSSTGNIGQVGTPIGTNVNSLTATTTNGSVAVTNLGDLTSATAQASGAGNGINLATTFASVGSPGNLAILNLSAPGTVTLNAAGTIQNASGSAPVSASHLSMTAGGAIGAGAGAQILTNAGTIDLASTTNGGIYIEDQGHVALTTAMAGGAGNDLVITADTGNMTVGAVSANHTVSLAANSGSIVDDANATTRIVTSSAILSSSTSSTADIGQLGDAIGTNVGSLTVQGSNAGHVFLDNLNSLTLIGVGAQAGSLSTASITADNGNITIGNVNAANGVTLTTLAGSILDNGTGLGITSGSLVLSAAQAIGSSANPIRTNGLAALGATSGTNPGGSNPIWITNTGAGLLALSGITASGPGNDITISAVGNQLVNAGTTQGGALSLTAASIGAAGAGNLLPTRVSSVNATASSGGVFLANQGDLGAVTAAATGGAVDITNQGNVATATIQATGGGNGIDLTTTAGGSAGNLAIKTLSAPGTVTLNAAGTIQNAPSSTLVSASDLSMTAGGAIGGPAAGSQIVTNAGTIDLATTTNGGIYIEDQSAATLTTVTAGGAGNDFVFTGDGVTTTAGTVSANHAVTLNTLGALNDDGNNATKITTGTLTLGIGTSIGAATASGEIDTAASTINATAANGSIFLSNQGDLTSVTAHATGGSNGISLTTTAGGSAGNLGVKDINAPGTVILNAVGTIQNAFGSIPLVASHLSMTAGGAIGGTSGAQIVTSASNIDLAATTNGGIYIEDQAPFTLTTATAGGAGNDVVVTGDSGAMTVGTVSAGHAVTLTAATALNDDGNDATRISTNLLTLSAGTSIGATGTHNEIDTSASSITATGNNGGVYIGDAGTAGGLTLSNVRSLNTGDVVVASGGDITAGTVSSLNQVTLSSGGSLFGSGPAISGPNGVTLSAANAIGQVTTFSSLSGTPVSLTSNGPVSASVSNPTGQINLDISGAPTFAANSISLGGGAASAGTVVLQSANSLNVGALSAGAIQLGNGNTSSLGLSSGNILTLPSSIVVTDYAPSTLLVRGTADVVDSANTRTFAFNATALNFQSGAQGGATTLNTAVGTLDATVGNGQSLTVHETGSMTVGSVSAGNVSIDATGALTDDSNNATRIAGNNVTLSGSALGASGTNNELDTQAGVLNVTSTAGGTYIGEADGATLTGSATGGPLVVQAGGTLAVAGASGTNVTLSTTGAASDLIVTGAINGNGGPVNLQTAGANSAISVAANITTTGDVGLTAGPSGTRGAIFQTAGLITAHNLAAVGSSVGNSGAALNTSVSSLSATAEAGNIYVTQSGDLAALTASAAGGVVNVATTGAMTVGSASGTGVTLAASGNGAALTLAGPVDGGAGLVSLAADGAINSNGAQITAGSLIASGASVGANGSPLNTTIPLIGATATNGGIYIQNTGKLTLIASATGGAVQVGANGGLTAGNVSGTGVSLTASGASSPLILNGLVNSGTGDLTLTAGSAVVADPASFVSGANAVVRGAQVGTPTARLNTAVNSLDVATTNGDIYVNEADGMALTAATNGTVDVKAGGAIVGSTAGRVSAGTVTLSGTAIGASGTPVNTTATTLNATSSQGGIFLNEQDAASLTASATGGPVNVQAGGVLTVASVTGDGATLTTTGSGSNINLNGAVNGGSGAVALNAAGALINGAGSQVTGGALTVTGTVIASSANPLATTVSSLNATSTAGGIYVNEADGLTLAASATGGSVNVQTANGALVVSGATGNSISLVAGGAGSGLTVNGAVSGGSGDVTLTAGTTSSPGAVAAGAGNSVAGGTLTVTGSSIGSSSSALNTRITTLKANATQGGVYVNEQDGLTLADVRAGSDVSVSSAAGDIAVQSITASNNVSLTAGSGAIADDGDNTTVISGKGVTLLAKSIGAPATLAASVLDSKLRLDIQANTLEATSTNGGIYIDALNGLASASVHASGGTVGNIELLAPTGDLNLLKVSASNTLLLAAGGNIIGLPGLGTMTARSAELRAGGGSATAGRIGSLAQPLSLQLDPGNTLHIYVPASLNTNDATLAPSTLPSAGVTTTLSTFNAPNALSVQAGFGQFQGLSDTLFTSPAEALVRSIQNQTATVQSVVGIDWASFNPNVSLFGTLDPSVCLPGDQRDEEKGGGGC
jgi:hypothetical protein